MDWDAEGVDWKVEECKAGGECVAEEEGMELMRSRRHGVDSRERYSSVGEELVAAIEVHLHCAFALSFGTSAELTCSLTVPHDRGQCRVG